jgi:lauroyl/myristoyl acyltransferase
MSDKQWNGKSKGHKYGYLFFIYTIRIFPLTLNYSFLLFISYFYYLFTPLQKKNLMSFYATVFPNKTKVELNQLVKTNYYRFAQTIVDRVAFLTNKKKDFEFEHDGHQNIWKHLNKGKGLILLGSHIGNWEVAGEMLHEKGIKVKVNVLLVDQEREQVKEVLESVKRANSFEIIPIKDDFSHIIKMKNAVENGEIVCVLGDRFVNESRTIEAEFFNEKVYLPLGIFKFIEKFKVPTLFFYNIKTSSKKYLLYAIEPSSSNIAEDLANDYIRVLKRMVVKYPTQFYNYFMFVKK